MLGKALRLADSLKGVQVLHAKRIKPLNLEQLSSYVHKTGKLLVLEDGCVHSGVGEHIVSHITKEKSLAFELLGVKDKFPQLGTIEDVYEHVGIDDATILKTARALLKK